MTVLCLGLPRTGTESLALALSHPVLSLPGPVHHGWNNNADPRDCATWCAFASFKRRGTGKLVPRADLERVLGCASAVADFPMSAFWRDLVEAYPEARIVVNRRGEGKRRAVEGGKAAGGGAAWVISEEEARAWKESMWNSFVGIAEGRFVGWGAKLLGLAGWFEAEAAWVNIVGLSSLSCCVLCVEVVVDRANTWVIELQLGVSTVLGLQFPAECGEYLSEALYGLGGGDKGTGGSPLVC